MTINRWESRLIRYICSGVWSSPGKAHTAASSQSSKESNVFWNLISSRTENISLAQRWSCTDQRPPFCPSKQQGSECQVTSSLNFQKPRRHVLPSVASPFPIRPCNEPWPCSPAWKPHNQQQFSGLTLPRAAYCLLDWLVTCIFARTKVVTFLIRGKLGKNKLAIISAICLWEKNIIPTRGSINIKSYYTHGAFYCNKKLCCFYLILHFYSMSLT